MFKKIDYTQFKENVWQEKQTIDFSEVKPVNLKYIVLKDDSLEITKEKSNEFQNLDIQDYYSLVVDNSHLFTSICNLYFHLINFNIPLTCHLICSALNMSEKEIEKICYLFECVILAEDYPIFKDNKIFDYMQSIQVTGLSNTGKEVAKKLISENEVLNSLYNGKIADDLKETAFFQFENLDNHVSASNDIYKQFVNDLFKNDYFKQCGKLNVSSLSFEELTAHPLCIELSKQVNTLYLLNYDMEYNEKSVFVKYLQWK